MSFLFSFSLVFFYAIFGVLSVIFLSPFSIVFLLLQILLILISHFFSKQILHKSIPRAILSIFSIGNILLWISLFVSERDVPGLTPDLYDVEKIVAKGGFPLTAFNYPTPPMGNDVPPFSMWPNFYLNMIFWFLIAILIFFIFPKKIREDQKFLRLIFLFGLAFMFGGFGYLMARFD